MNPNSIEIPITIGNFDGTSIFDTDAKHNYNNERLGEKRSIKVEEGDLTIDL